MATRENDGEVDDAASADDACALTPGEGTHRATEWIRFVSIRFALKIDS